MIYSRKKMKSKIEKYEDRISDNILKVMYFVRNHKSSEFNSYVTEINKGIKKLYKYNQSVKGKLNYSNKQLFHVFGYSNLGILNDILTRLTLLESHRNFPTVMVKEEDMEDIHNVVKILVDKIINNKKMRGLDFVLFDR